MYTSPVMNIYEISILSTGTQASIKRKCENLNTAMEYAAMLARLHYVEHFATRFIQDLEGNMVAVWHPSKNAWRIID